MAWLSVETHCRRRRSEGTRQYLIEAYRALLRESRTVPTSTQIADRAAVEAITDFESWARMRELHGLSPERACAAWTRSIDRLLPPMSVS